MRTQGPDYSNQVLIALCSVLVYRIDISLWSGQGVGNRRCSTSLSRKEKCPTVQESIVHFAMHFQVASVRCGVWMAAPIGWHSTSLASCPVGLHHHLMMFPTEFWSSSASQLVQHQFCCLTMVRRGSSQNHKGLFPCGVKSWEIPCARHRAFERSEIDQELTARELANTNHPTRIKLT